MLDMEPKQRTMLPRYTRRESTILQFAPVTEVTPESANAEPEIVATESGRLRAFRRRQPWKRHPGISASCDGVSNVTDCNLEQPEKAESPRVETEGGKLKDERLVQPANAKDAILRRVVGESKETSVNSLQLWKQLLPMAETHVGTLTERSWEHPQNP
jgi:hypothetical protein